MDNIINWEDKECSLAFLGQFYSYTCENSLVRHAQMIDHIINIILNQEERIRFLESKLTTGE